MPKALCFDLDNTLLDDDASLRACVRRVCDDLMAHLPPFDVDSMTRDYISLSDSYWVGRPYEAAALPDARLKFWTETLASYGCSDSGLVLHARDAYARYRFEFAEVYGETRRVLEELHGRYPLAVITNGVGDQQRARLERAGLTHFFDAVVASTDVNAGKPDAAVFAHALSLLGASARDTWHIGDSLTADVQGARTPVLGAPFGSTARARPDAPASRSPTMRSTTCSHSRRS